jgi:hypothetical protein
MKKESITDDKVRHIIECLSDDNIFKPTDDQIKKSKSNIVRYLRLDMIKPKNLNFPRSSGLILNKGVIVLSSSPSASLNALSYSFHDVIDTKDYIVREIID